MVWRGVECASTINPIHLLLDLRRSPRYEVTRQTAGETTRTHTNFIMADAEKIEATVSQEEVDKAKEEIEAADPGGEDEAKTEFEVTTEELSILRAELACEFPDDYKYFR